MNNKVFYTPGTFGNYVAFLIDSKNKDYDMDHSMNLALIDPSGKYHGFFKTPYSPEMMAEALESVIKFSN